MKHQLTFPYTQLLKQFLAVAFLCCSGFIAQAVANNDNFANAQLFSGTSGTVNGSNVGYSKEVGEPDHAGDPGGHSAWYVWTAPADGNMTINLAGSSFDTLLGVYTGNSVSNLTEVVSNDDASPGVSTSLVQFQATQGTTYFIAVDGYGGDTGSIVLNFGLNTIAQMDVVANPTDGGTVTGSGNFAISSLQSISATANSGWAFTGWDDGNTNATRTILIPYDGITYTANFSPLAALNVVANPANAGTVTGSGTYAAGTSQVITATPNSGYGFVNWSDGNTSASRSVTVPVSGATYTANFNQLATLTVVASPSNQGTVTGSGTFAVGASRSITATAASGYFFVSWNDGNYQSPRSVTLPVGGSTYTASFQAIANDNNDNFANALVLSGSQGYVIDSNTAFTKEAGEPNHAGNNGGSSAWYSWTAPANGYVTFSTGRSTFDTLLAVYTGTAVNNLSLVASNDDTGSSLAARPGVVAFNATQGTTYKVAVDGYNGATGTIFLSYQPSSLVPVVVQANPAAGGTMIGSGTYPSGSALQISGSVNAGYAFTGWDDGDPRLTRLVTVPDGGGTFTANFLKSTGSNDAFAGAQLLTGSFGVISGTNTAYTKETGEPNHAGNSGGASAWFTWTAPVTGPVTFDTIGSSFDTLLAVYTGTSVNNLSVVASNNDIDATTRQSKVTFSATAGTAYKIAVDGYFGASGNFTLTFQQLQGVVSVVASPSLGGTVTGSGTFAVGYVDTITAAAKPGYVFTGWNNGSTQTTRTVAVQTGTTVYTANFSTSGTIAVTATPSLSGSVYGAGTYVAGSLQKISAIPNAGYLFTSWNDGNTQNPRTVTTGTANTLSFTGTFAQAAALNVQISPVNGGTVVGSGTFLVNTFQQISATANSGWMFTGWSDGNTQNPRTVKVPTSGTSYTANFAQLINDNNDNFANALVVTGYVGSGTDNNIGFTLEGGEPVPAGISGTSSAWYSWTAPASGLVTFDTQYSSFDTVLAVYTGNSLNSLTQIAANDDASNAVRWSQVSFSAVAGTTYFIAVDAVGQGGIIVLNHSQNVGLTVVANPSLGGSVTGSGTFLGGSSQQITATANSGWVFTGWSDGNTNSSRTVTNTGLTTYTANFSQTAAITVSSSPSVGGTTTGAGTYIVGSTQQISAGANSGWTFTGWSDGNTNNPRSVIIPLSGTNYTANFSQIATLTLVGNPVLGGTLSGGGTYITGSSVVISATPAPGYAFTGWSDGITTNPRTIVVPGAGAVYTGTFAPTGVFSLVASPSIGGSVSGSGTFVLGSTQTITATPNAGWKFVRWQGVTGVSVHNPLAVTITSGTTTAVFAPNTVEWKGSYYGVFNDLATGALTVKLNPMGSYTASLNVGGYVSSAHGVFDANGNNVVSFNKTPYVLVLTMEASKGAIQAILSSTAGIKPGTVASFELTRSMVDSGVNPAPYAANFTFLLKPDNRDSKAPKGNGFGTLSVSKHGDIRVSGKLGDGSAFAQSSALTKDSTLPLYAAVSKVATMDWYVVGMLKYEDLVGSDWDGTLAWSKPVRLTDSLYPLGINTTLSFIGSRFTPGITLFAQYQNSYVSIQKSNLSSLFAGTLSSILGYDKLGASGANSVFFTLSQNSKTGLLTGKFTGLTDIYANPWSPTLQGIIFQKTHIGGGWYIDDLHASAPFNMSPNAPVP